MLDELEIVKDILDDCENLEYKLMGNITSRNIGEVLISEPFQTEKFSIQIDISKSTIDSELKKFVDHYKFVNNKNCERDFSYSIIKRIEKLTNFKYLYFHFGVIPAFQLGQKDVSLLYLAFHNDI